MRRVHCLLVLLSPSLHGRSSDDVDSLFSLLVRSAQSFFTQKCFKQSDIENINVNVALFAARIKELGLLSTVKYAAPGVPMCPRLTQVRSAHLLVCHSNICDV